MQGMDHGRNHQAEDGATASWLRTLGAALLAAVAVFFAGESLWRPTYRQFVAQAVVSGPASTASLSSSLDLEAIRAQLNAEVPSTAHLNIYRQYQTSGASERRVAIEFTDGQESAALATVDRLSRVLLSQGQANAAANAHQSPELTAAQARLTAAQAKEDAARRALDGLTKQHFESVRHLEQAAADLAPATTVVEAPQQRVPNPLWTRLQNQIDALETKRDGLLIKLTEEHPEVRDVDAQLTELESRLASTNRWEGAEPNADRNLPTSNAEEQAALAAKLQFVAEQRNQYRAAVHAYELARGERYEAQAAVEILSQPSSLAASVTSTTRWELAEPAHIVGRIPAISAAARYLVLAGAGLLAAFAVLAVLRPRPSAQAIAVERQPELKPEPAVDIEALLGMPVITRLARSSRN